MTTGGDIIMAVNGRPVKDMGDLQCATSSKKVGQGVTLIVERGQQTLDLPVTLADRPASPGG